MRSSNPALRATAVVAVLAALTAGTATTAQAGKTIEGQSPAAARHDHDHYRYDRSARPLSHQVGPRLGLPDRRRVHVLLRPQRHGRRTPAPQAGPPPRVAGRPRRPRTTRTTRMSSFQLERRRSRTRSAGTTTPGTSWSPRSAPAQAWTDYYDLDYFGEIWAEGRYKAVEGTARTFTLTEGKELYLDCVGPVAHGYPGTTSAAAASPALPPRRRSAKARPPSCRTRSARSALPDRALHRGTRTTGPALSLPARSSVRGGRRRPGPPISCSGHASRSIERRSRVRPSHGCVPA